MTTEADNSDWMSKLPVELHDVPLNCLAIPGSHNSMTAKLSQTEIGPDTAVSLSSVVKMLRKEKLLYDWSKTQHLYPKEQLKAGIRYFDLRVCLLEGDYQFTHGLLAGRVADFLNEIKEFLNDHSKEIVLLDFSHFYTMDAEETHKKLIRLIIDTIGREKLCLYVGVGNCKLSDLWSSSQQVLVFYHHHLAEDHPELWPSDCIESPWANTDKPNLLMEFLNQQASSPRPGDKFYVTQGVLTPRLDDIVRSFFNSATLESMALQIEKPYVEFLARQKIGPQGLNITLIDFIEKDHYVKTVMDLNKPELLTSSNPTVDSSQSPDTSRANATAANTNDTPQQ